MRISTKSLFITITIFAIASWIIRQEFEFYKLKSELRSLSVNLFAVEDGGFISSLLPSKGSYSVRVGSLSPTVATKLTAVGRITSLSVRPSVTLSEAGLNLIASFKNLRELDLQGSQITDNDLQIVSKLRNLEGLNLSNTSVGDEGLRYLSDHRLKVLCLNETCVTNAGIATISRYSHLEELEIMTSNITYIGLLQLENSRASLTLRRVLVFKDYHNDAGQSELQSRLPHCRVDTFLEQLLPFSLLTERPSSFGTGDDPFADGKVDDERENDIFR